VPLSPPHNHQRNRQIEDWLRRARRETLDACRQHLQVVAGSEVESDFQLPGKASDLVREPFLVAQGQCDNFRGETAEQFFICG